MKVEGEAAKMLVAGMCSGMASNKERDMRKNGLECPECSSELFDSEGGVIHLDPPRKRTRCRKCTYRGWREIETEPA